MGNRKRNVVLLSGVTCSGKSTLSASLARAVGGKVVTYGEVIAGAVAAKVSHEDLRRDPRKATAGDIARADEIVVAHVERLREGAHVIVELHPATLAGAVWRATPFRPAVLHRLDPSGAIQLVAKPQTVLRRMRARGVRGRLPTTSQLKLLMRLQEAAMLAYGSTVGFPVFYVAADAGESAVLRSALTCMAEIGVSCVRR